MVREYDSGHVKYGVYHVQYDDGEWHWEALGRTAWAVEEEAAVVLDAVAVKR